VFPGTASRNTYGFHVEDWIYWRINVAAYPIEKSPIVVPLGSASSNLFRCPVDRDDRDRLAISDGNGPYFYSYSMTSYDLNNGQNRGMASINNGSWYPFKATAIRNPARKIMLAEEQSALRGTEVSDPTGGIINDGRWVGTSDVLTSRHARKACIAFADSHVLAVPWKFGQDAANSRPDL
jgi:hypothetical protein